jgi:transcriptional regulator with XRE-family HTH domain
MLNAVGKRLKEARESLGLSLRGFAAPLDVSYGSVMNWESGRAKLSKPLTKAVERIHNISSDWLTTGEGEMFVTVNRDAAVPRPLTGADKFPEDFVFPPHLSSRTNPAIESPFSATYAKNKVTPCVMSFSKPWLEARFGVHYSYLFLFDVVGDAMEPTVGDKDTVMLDITGDYRPGIWAIMIDERFVLARLKENSVGQHQACFDNPKYPPIEFNAQRITFFGRVVWIFKNCD